MMYKLQSESVWKISEQVPALWNDIGAINPLVRRLLLNLNVWCCFMLYWSGFKLCHSSYSLSHTPFYSMLLHPDTNISMKYVVCIKAPPVCNKELKSRGKEQVAHGEAGLELRKRKSSLSKLFGRVWCLGWDTVAAFLPMQQELSAQQGCYPLKTPSASSGPSVDPALVSCSCC